MYQALMYQAAMLAAVALVGYLFGRVGRKKSVEEEAPQELQRASQVAVQLEAIADDLRQDLARHRAEVERFKRQLSEAATSTDGELDEAAWRRLEELAEEVLGPTLQLGGQLTGAYDRIRRQTQALTHFTGGRMDRQTGLGNHRALEEQLALLLERKSDEAGFCIAMLSVASSGGAPGEENEDKQSDVEKLSRVAALLRRNLRQSDFAARYGVDELVVVMPDTTNAGARVFGDRFREQVLGGLGLRVCGGLAESLPGDTPKSLLARADSALYSARAAGPGRQYAHSGDGITPADQPLTAAADGPSGRLSGD